MLGTVESLFSLHFDSTAANSTAADPYDWRRVIFSFPELNFCRQVGVCCAEYHGRRGGHPVSLAHSPLCHRHTCPSLPSLRTRPSPLFLSPTVVHGPNPTRKDQIFSTKAKASPTDPDRDRRRPKIFLCLARPGLYYFHKSESWAQKCAALSKKMHSRFLGHASVGVKENKQVAWNIVQVSNEQNNVRGVAWNFNRHFTHRNIRRLVHVWCWYLKSQPEPAL